MSDDKVVELKVIDGGKKDAPAAVTIACHCSSTNFELLTGSKIKCSRCGCVFGGSWKWEAQQ